MDNHSTHFLMSPFVPLTAQTFIREYHELGCRSFGEGSALSRRYRALFGVSPYVTSRIWNMLLPRLPPNSRARHLLYALLFLKVYASEHVHTQFTGVSENTFRKWCWGFVRSLSELDVIKWDRRLTGRERSPFKASVDGTDFRIQEPIPLSPKWYSHKFKGPGLRYEVGVGVHKADIVWTHGPFPCGSFNDLRIYQLGMILVLGNNKRVIADGGYQDPSCSYPLRHHGGLKFGFIRARHEAVNKRLKQFGVLGNRFRHGLFLHSYCFYAVLNAVQLSIENGEAIFTNYG